MYPLIKDGGFIGTVTYKSSGEIYYFLENAKGKKIFVNYDLWNIFNETSDAGFVKLPNKYNSIIPLLKKYDFIQTSRFVKGKGVFNYCILFSGCENWKTSKRFVQVLNRILPIISVITFVIGLKLFRDKSVHLTGGFNIWIFFGLMILSVCLHELGHLMTNIACGNKVLSIGVTLVGFFPSGAYVSYLERKDIQKIEKIQIALSGIEMNILISGICFLGASIFPSVTYLLYLTAINNLVLTFFNLIPASGLDGEAALSALLEVKSINEIAKKMIFKKRYRYRLFHSGIAGYFCFFILTMILIFQLILWIIIAFDVSIAILILIRLII